MKRIYLASLLALVVAGIVIASTTNNVVTSANPTEPPATVQTTRRGSSTARITATKARQVQQAMSTSEEATSPGRPPGSVIIPVVFHVITTSSGEGDVSEAEIDATIAHLNAAFSGGLGGADTPYRFAKRQVTTRTANDDWFNATRGSQADRDMKTALNAVDRNYDRKSILNIYTSNGGDPSLGVGYSSYAFDYPSDPAVDGVVVFYPVLPGGEDGTPYEEGDAVVHEVGHWLGLYFIFEGGCSDTAGDFVSDTPAQSAKTVGCPVVLPDSCPNHPGLDQFQNYMDISDDACRNMFTPGQAARMDALGAQYRYTKRRVFL